VLATEPALYVWATIGLFVVALVVGLSTASGRSFVGRLFRGQTVQQLTQTYADRVAAVESAYKVVVAENKRIGEEADEMIRRLEEENRELKGRVTTLERLVTAKTEIDTLTATIHEYHQETRTALDTLLTAVTGRPG
jgi:hypothetical protein